MVLDASQHHERIDRHLQVDKPTSKRRLRGGGQGEFVEENWQEFRTIEIRFATDKLPILSRKSTFPSYHVVTEVLLNLLVYLYESVEKYLSGCGHSLCTLI